MDDVGIDFAVVAWSEDQQWHITPAPMAATGSLAALEQFGRRYQGESGAVILAAVADEFFFVVRIQGKKTRYLLSDVAAAWDWEIAEQLLEKMDLGIDIEDVEELPDGEPAGDLALLEDLGMTDTDLDVLCADLELFVDEQIGVVAQRLGFGPALTGMMDGALA